ncbi:hypothetical protein [Citreimonas salinaria]|uniref:FlgN protein n=1 Tax=Citreimonas salinaria TaxID=321339 RepID=A0A1H3EVK2_9RHOB|nr:hypothetical protein [Citreimonas salinaria]SDX82650.1 hypothetical protein SAMN05444340_10116 [Citreimonas salinaria]
MAEALERLKAIVEAEREALLSGDFERLTALLPDKEQALAEVEGAGSTPDSLRDLHRRVERNQALYDRALAGVRAVIGRIAELGEVKKSIGTYDSAGKRRTIDIPKHAHLEKRA